MASNCPTLLVSGQRENQHENFTPLWAHLSMMHQWLANLYTLHVTVHFTSLYITHLFLLYYTELVFVNQNFLSTWPFLHDEQYDLCTLLNALHYRDFPGHIISIRPAQTNLHCTSSHSTRSVRTLISFSQKKFRLSCRLRRNKNAAALLLFAHN